MALGFLASLGFLAFGFLTSAPRLGLPDLPGAPAWAFCFVAFGCGLVVLYYDLVQNRRRLKSWIFYARLSFTGRIPVAITAATISTNPVLLLLLRLPPPLPLVASVGTAAVPPLQSCKKYRFLPRWLFHLDGSSDCYCHRCDFKCYILSRLLLVRLFILSPTFLR